MFVFTGSLVESVKARQIFDSRGNPTVEVDIRTDKGIHKSVTLYPCPSVLERNSTMFYSKSHCIVHTSTEQPALCDQNFYYILKCQSRQLMHCDTLKQDNDSTVRGDGGSRVGEVRAGTTSPMPEHKGFKLQ